MKITFLGTGTSTGVPNIGCDCPICTSAEKKNKRFRSSIIIHHNNFNILIDTSTDLRMQALINNIRRVDAVLFTHTHADHLNGIDELRSFNFIQDSIIPCYGNRETIERIQMGFSYIFTKTQEGGGKPKISTHVIDREIDLFGVKITPVNIMHGDIVISGYRINDTAYLTDCSAIPLESKKLLGNLELLILGALRFEPHPTHFCIDEALREIEEIKPKRALFTHINHNIDYNTVNPTLPPNVELAYDGMVIDGLS